MKLNKQTISSIIHIAVILAATATSAHARSLDSAAGSAVNTVFSIAKKASLLPIGVGGLLFLVGASQIGKQILIGGILGIALIFGADGVRSALSGVFGA